MGAFISSYLRSLWNLAPQLHEGADDLERVILSPLGLHLPKSAPEGFGTEWFLAASAHAGAHLMFSRQPFSGADLRPVTQALIGVLEDTRVELLAVHELPGLRRLWRQFHDFGPTSAPTFEELLKRLSRALLDPGYEDPHPWVQKGRTLFARYSEGRAGPATLLPQELRLMASLLGNDIGQMRLQFNSRLYRVWPSYRDDNSHLWLPDEKNADVVHELAVSGSSVALGSGLEVQASDTELFRYPEWDIFISGNRFDWVTVLDSVIAVIPGRFGVRRDRLRTQEVFPKPRKRVLRQNEGEELDLDAVVQAAVSLRIQERPEERVFERRLPEPKGMSTLFLLDASASTGAQLEECGMSTLEISQAMVLSWVIHLERRHHPYAIHTFSSDGRKSVYYARVKEFSGRFDAVSFARLMSIRSQWSTRFGAALRHATHLLLQQRAASRRIVLFTDGQPHDVDIFDSRYLAEDARRAVLDAKKRGVCVQCVCVDRRAASGLLRIFGPGNVQCLSVLRP